VLKPSSDAPAIAYKFFELLEEAGLPAGVVNFMTGSGAEVGDVVVDSSEDPLHCFHGIERSRLADKRARGQDSTGPTLDQTSGKQRWAAKTQSS